MQSIDTLIHAAYIVPVEPEGVVLENHALAIDAGRIVALLPSAEARERFSARQVIDRPNHILMPGLINAHTHAAMSLKRGLADDLPLMKWLTEHIWPVEARFVGESFVRDGTRLAMAEMLRGGVTCFSDMYFFPDETARVAQEAGMRAVIGLIVIDFPTAWAQGPDEYFAKGHQLHDAWRDHPLISTAFAPHAPYTVSNGPLEKVALHAEELDIPIHMHIHETRDEVEQGLANFGNRPLTRLKELGLLTPRLIAVHMTQLTDEEIDELAESGVHVAHCPESNLKLASGFCPTAKLASAGVNLALGTDGSASNNDLDMFGEMRTAALLAKGVAGDASALPAARVLRMATLDGARALGIDERTGSLLPGKAADIAAVEISALETQPLYNAISQLVYCTGRHQVSDVWVNGRHLLNERRLTTLDEREVVAKAREWQVRIAEFRAQR